MKRIITSIVAVVMLMVLSVAAVAAPFGFLESPTAKSPILVSASASRQNSAAKVIVSPYTSRDDLSEESKTEMNNAYDAIVANSDAYKAAIGGIADAKKLSSSDLAVSELFYVTLDGYEAGEKVTVTVKADGLDKFAGLMQFVDGKWVVVEGASVNGSELTFVIDTSSPLAVVVNKNVKAPAETNSANNVTTGNNPQTGDDGNSYFWVWGSIAVVAMAAIVVVAVKSKKVRD